MANVPDNWIKADQGILPSQSAEHLLLFFIDFDRPHAGEIECDKWDFEVLGLTRLHGADAFAKGP